MTRRFRINIIRKRPSYFASSRVANIIVEIVTDDDISVLFARWQRVL